MFLRVRNLLPLTLLVLLGALLTVGCNSGRKDIELPPLHPVRGTVKRLGAPVKGYRVTFHPQGEIGAVKYLPQAITGDDGSFTLTTYHPEDGAPAGEYIVTFEWPDHIINPEDPDPVPEKDKLRGAFANPQRSKFKATISAGENQLPDFVL